MPRHIVAIAAMLVAAIAVPVRAADSAPTTIAPAIAIAGCNDAPTTQGAIAGIKFSAASTQSPFALASVGPICGNIASYPYLSQTDPPCFSFAGDTGANALQACGADSMLSELTDLVFGSSAGGLQSPPDQTAPAQTAPEENPSPSDRSANLLETSAPPAAPASGHTGGSATTTNSDPQQAPPVAPTPDPLGTP